MHLSSGIIPENIPSSFWWFYGRAVTGKKNRDGCVAGAAILLMSGRAV